jgi:hypothetical protein
VQEGVFVTLSSFSATGRGSAALDDNYAAVAVMPGKEVKRIPNVGSMQMSAQNHFDLLFNKAVDRALCAGHCNVENTVMSGCKLMMGDNNSDFIVCYPGKNLFAMLKLMTIEPTIGDAAPWRGGIETNQYCVTDMEDRIKFW